MSWKAIAWKEVRETYWGGGRPVVGTIVGTLFMAVFAVAVPIGFALAFRTDEVWPYVLAVAGTLIGLAGFTALMAPLATAADAFAGERERHTLETLLAGPVSDGAIVTGKIVAQYVAPIGNTVLLAVLGGLTATVIVGAPGLVVLGAVLVAGGLVSLVAATAFIGIGTLLSLRAPTVRKAQERIGYVMFPVFLLPGLFGSVLPRIVELDLGQTLLIGALVPALLLVVAVVSIPLVYARFQRDRIIAK